MPYRENGCAVYLPFSIETVRPYSKNGTTVVRSHLRSKNRLTTATITAFYGSSMRHVNLAPTVFAFITSRVAELTIQLGKAIYITSGRDVVTVGSGHPCMLECSHEEADTRIVVHIVHTLQQGMRKIEIRTVDTDIIVILAGVYFKLVMAYQLLDIWVAFGKGKKSSSTVLITFVPALENRNHKHYQSFMH